MTNMPDHRFSELGSLGANTSTHTARTLMLRELSLLIDYVQDPRASRQAYVHAITQENCLHKRSSINRKITARHLIGLYGLDNSDVVFRALRFFWMRESTARPLLAFLCACTKDSILRNMAIKVVELPLNTVITSADTESWIEESWPGRFSSASLRSIAQNLNSTWTQACYLNGRVNKKRVGVSATPGIVAYALFIAHLEGSSGRELFESKYIKMLGCSSYEAITLAQEASQRGWITVNRVAEVIQVQFPRLLNPS